MKRAISLILCLIIILSLFTSCTGTGNNPEGKNGGVQSGMQKNNSSGSVGLKITGAKEKDILVIAKKYYDFYIKHLDKMVSSDVAAEIRRETGNVSFDGKLKDDDLANSLCNKSTLSAVFEGQFYCKVLYAAASVGWSAGYARSANTLAAVLVSEKDIPDKNRLNDAKKLAEYAISLDGKSVRFYLTLAQIRYEQKDTDGALEAVDAALALDSGHHEALTFKLQLIVERGGSGMSAAAKSVGEKLKENDGELSKRLTGQENDTKNQQPGTSSDSTEELKKKLDDICKLEVITSADMVEILFPTQAKNIRDKIITVTAEEKDLNFPKFPSNLYQSAKQVTTEAYRTAIKQYREWLKNYRKDLMKEISKAEKSALDTDKARLDKKLKDKAAYAADPTDKTAADYMTDYNLQVLTAAENDFLLYKNKRYMDFSKESEEMYGALIHGWTQAQVIYFEDKKAAGKLPEEQKGPAFAAADAKYALAVNAASEQYVQAIVPEYAKLYNDMKEEGQKLWEKMLPFARCTLSPEYNVVNLYSTIVLETLSVLGDFSGNDLEMTRYDHNYTAEDLADAEKAMALAKEYMAAKAKAAKAKTNADFTISVKLCDEVEIKLSSTSIEVEYVNGYAARVAYNWKKEQMELGVGYGKKSDKLPIGGSVKAFANVVFDLRNQTVTDVYISAEAKLSMNTGHSSMEMGGTVNISLMGKGASLSAAAKAEVGRVGIEHQKEIIKQE